MKKHIQRYAQLRPVMLAMALGSVSSLALAQAQPGAIPRRVRSVRVAVGCRRNVSSTEGRPTPECIATRSD
jgi:hypothetical protein